MLEEIRGCLIKADDAAAPGFWFAVDENIAGVVDCVVNDELLTVEMYSVSS